MLTIHEQAVCMLFSFEIPLGGFILPEFAVYIIYVVSSKWAIYIVIE